MNAKSAIFQLLPEVLLCLSAMIVLFSGMIGGSRRAGIAPILTLAALAVGLFATLFSEGLAADWFDVAMDPVAGLSSDSVVFFVRVATMLIGMLIVLVNWHVPRESESPEFFSLLLFSLAGVTLTATADDLLLLFLALELVSVPTYIMIGLSRSDAAAQESTVKYFFLGAFAAAITLYGFSFLYGASGTTLMVGLAPGLGQNVPSIAGSVASGGINGMLRIGLLLAFAGLSFKIAAVPFHFYIADVYQGAASPVAGMLGFVPKVAGFVALIRLFNMIGWQLDDALYWMVWGVAVATMCAGNTLALMQRFNVKRVLAYSGIAHSGYMLIALLAGPGIAARMGAEFPFRNGVSAILFYLVIYGITNIGAFAVLACFKSPRTGESIESFDDLEDVVCSKPWPAIALAICAVGLMGLPPTVGMIGKMFIFSAALATAADSPHHTATIVLVVIGMLNAAVGAAYYLRIAAVSVMSKRRDEIDADATARGGHSTSMPLYAGLTIAAAFVIFSFVHPYPLIDSVRIAGDSSRDRAARIAQNDSGVVATPEVVAATDAR